MDSADASDPAPAFRYDGSGVHRSYDSGRALTDEARRVWSAEIREHLGGAPGRRVVDLGAGTGRFSGLLRDLLTARVYAVDSSADMLGQAVAKPELAGVALVRAAAEALPFRGATVDAVFVYLAFHHFADRDAALAECWRVLAPGGRLMICSPTLETLDSFLWMRFFPTADRIDRARIPPRHAIIDAGRRGGLALERQWTVARGFTLGPTEYAERVGRRTFSALVMISDAEFDAGIRALRRDCVAREPGERIGEHIDVFLFRR